MAKIFTFFVDATHPEQNLIWATAIGDLNLEKIQVTAETMEEAIQQVKNIIANPNPEE